MQKREYQKVFDKDKNFWSVVFVSIENEWLQSLANIYEDSKYSQEDKIISAYSLIKNQKDKKGN